MKVQANQSKDARQAARNILRHANITDLRGLILEDFIRWHPNCHLQESPLHSAQGRIQFLGSSALITINSNVKNKRQRRFIMAHEFGHFNLHFGLKPLYNCSEEALKQWLSSGGHEQEANEFAAELLMPKKVFTAEFIGNGFSLDLIDYLANRFETSLTATSRRIVEQGPYNMALIYSENGIVKWHTEPSSFPLRFVVIGGQTPPGSAARRYFDSGIVKPKSVESNVWYFYDNKVFQFSRARLRETLLPIPYYNGVLSFLSFE